jgi:hypothetical protein
MLSKAGRREHAYFLSHGGLLKSLYRAKRNSYDEGLRSLIDFKVESMDLKTRAKLGKNVNKVGSDWTKPCARSHNHKG